MRITFCDIITLLYKAHAQGIFEAWEHSVFLPLSETCKTPLNGVDQGVSI